jgi:hypothetical protein
MQKKTPIENAVIAVTVLHTVMRDFAAIANNALSVIVGSVYTKEIPPFTT